MSSVSQYSVFRLPKNDSEHALYPYGQSRLQSQPEESLLSFGKLLRYLAGVAVQGLIESKDREIIEMGVRVFICVLFALSLCLHFSKHLKVCQYGSRDHAV